MEDIAKDIVKANVALTKKDQGALKCNGHSCCEAAVAKGPRMLASKARKPNMKYAPRPRLQRRCRPSDGSAKEWVGH